MRGAGACTAAATAPAQGELLLDRPVVNAQFPGGPPAAVRLLRRIDRFPGRYLAGFVEVTLVALAGFQCVYLYGIVATPPEAPLAGTTGQPALLASAVLSTYDPFFGVVDAGSAPAIAATDLELHGVRQDGRTGGGSAIISQADGPQRSFGIGEAISPGLVLKAVGSGYATVARHGVDERLAFADFDPATSAPRPPDRNRPSAGPNPAGGRSSINFADPSTLPASLTAPAAGMDSSLKPGE